MAPRLSRLASINWATFQLMVCSGMPFRLVIPVVWQSLVLPLPSSTCRVRFSLCPVPWCPGSRNTVVPASASFRPSSFGAAALTEGTATDNRRVPADSAPNTAVLFITAWAQLSGKSRPLPFHRCSSTKAHWHRQTLPYQLPHQVKQTAADASEHGEIGSQS